MSELATTYWSSIADGSPVCFMALGYAFFALNRNAALKRVVWPFFLGAVCVYFLIRMALHGPIQILFVIGPILAFVFFVGLRAAVFCPSCGSTFRNMNLWGGAKLCPKCGANCGEDA